MDEDKIHYPVLLTFEQILELSTYVRLCMEVRQESGEEAKAQILADIDERLYDAAFNAACAGKGGEHDEGG